VRFAYSCHKNTIENITVRRYLPISNSTRITFMDDYGNRRFIYVDDEYKDVIDTINERIKEFNNDSQGMNYHYREHYCNCSFNIVA
jgi:hypothetical protein